MATLSNQLSSLCRWILLLATLVFVTGTGLAADTVLTISGVSGRDGVAIPPASFTLDTLHTMDRVTLPVKGRDGVERKYTGVRLSDLLKRAGQPQGEEVRGPLLSRYVMVTAHDGYHVVFSVPELDPGFTSAEAMVADTVDGKALAQREGPLRLLVPGEKREARWVRMVEKIEFVSVEVLR